MPTITQKELDKLRDKQGVYQSLRRSNSTAIKSLKISVTAIVEAAFRDYVRSHKGKHINKQLEDESWNRFQEYLQKYL